MIQSMGYKIDFFFFFATPNSTIINNLVREYSLSAGLPLSIGYIISDEIVTTKCSYRLLNLTYNHQITQNIENL